MTNNSVWLRLKVVIWKNCMIRKHHYILTIFEIALPVVLFGLLAFVRSRLSWFRREYIDHPTYTEQYSSRFLYYATFSNKSQIYYAPETEFTTTLIRKVQLKLKVKDEDVKGLKNEANLMAYYESFGQNKSIRAVVFSDIKGKGPPKHLKYVLKAAEKDVYWETDSVFNGARQLIYAEEAGSYQYFLTGLIAMQMALDTSYIEMMTKQNLPMELKMQEFPYPPYIRDAGIANVFHILLPAAAIMGFVLLIETIIKFVVEEKISGIKELMKMMGLQSWMLWLGWLVHAMMVDVISILLITYLMKVKVFGLDYPLLEHCNASVFAVFLFLYCISAVTFSFMISSIFNKPTLAIIVGMCIWVLDFNKFITSPKSKLHTKVLVGILSPTVMLRYGYSEIASYESRAIGSQWNNVFKPASGNSRDVSMGLAFISFLVSSVFFMLITLYVENIHPGPYGLAKPLHFPALYVWKKISKRRNRVEDEEQAALVNAKIEPAPNLKTGIAVKNLYKKYGSVMAVNDFSIDIYEGQITVLLGHNGAGKTTIMNVITGMIGATSGKVFISDQDIKYNMDKIRSSLGFCPQHSLHFTDLNVIEHLMFFAMLKGLSRKQARNEAHKWLGKMNLSQKQQSAASTLSGGMKRKLSLGIALIGNSKVLILDEPTSGLDPEARREIWDILLVCRGARTILITTHFMEEADVLGDRIAIVHHGQLICYGTSMFLKKEYGTGYNLTLVRDEEAFKARHSKDVDQVEAITSVVHGRIEKAVLMSTRGNHMSFLLPHDTKSYFGYLFETLQNNKEELCITNIALSVTTLEEVFLRVDSSVNEQAKMDKPGDIQRTDDNIAFVTNPSTKYTGQKLLRTQIWSLFKKRWCVFKRKWLLFAVAVFIATTTAILTIYLGEATKHPDSEGRFDFELSRYDKTTVFYGRRGSDQLLTNIERQYDQLVRSQGSKPEKVDSVSSELILEGELNIANFKQFMVVAAEFNTSAGNNRTINAMYSNPAAHGAPVSLNLLSNALLKGMMGNDYSISASNAPLPNLQGKTIAAMSSEHSMMMWVVLFPLGVLFVTSTFLMFPQMERASNVKQLQLMCGVRSVFYWLVCYVFDIILYLIAVAVLLLGIVLYGLVGSKAFSGKNEIGVLFAILLAYGVGVIPYVYIYSYKKTAAGAFVWYFTTSTFLGIILVIAFFLINLNVVKYLPFLIPYVGLLAILVQFSQKAVMNYEWDTMTSEHKETLCGSVHFDRNPCCDGDNTPKCIESRTYLSFDNDNTINFYHLLIMAASAILYFTILLLLESNFVQKLNERLLVLLFETRKRKRKESFGEHDRKDVTVEMGRIARTLKQEQNVKTRGAGEASSNAGSIEDLFLVHQLEKRYLRHKVVKGVSFAVKPGECFGLLGVNGAGKTTTFRILTGDAPLITGEARILTPTKERIYLSKQCKKYLKKVGYCPQFDSLNEVLTAREMLRVFAELRGIREGAEEEISMWLKILGLEEYADKPCGKYSGGNKRKLSVAIALIGGLPLVMLDEPTSGVDPVSRHRLWDTLSAIQTQEIKPSIILTSHSMEECEALCNKLAIMKAGQLECYGTIPNIKKKYAQGFTVMLKLKIFASSRPEQNVIDKLSVSQSRRQTSEDQQKSTVVEDPKEVKKLIEDFEAKYKGICTLKDKHTGLLHYHINDKNKKWSEIFKEIEKLQQKHPIIEDYNISETTLEEVFLSIARSED